MSGVSQTFQKNMDAFRLFYPGSADKWETGKCPLNEEIVVEIEESYQEDRILAVLEEGGRRLYLAGKYQPAWGADVWLQEQGRIHPHTVILIIGMGNVPLIRRLCENIEEEVMFVVYEPCLNIFQKAMEEYDVAGLLTEFPVKLLVEGLNSEFADLVLGQMIRMDNMLLTKVYISGNYRELFPEQVQGMVKTLRKHIDTLQVNSNTGLRYTNVVGSNVLNNIAYLYHGYSVGQYEKILPPDVPSIVVSAGPSLDKNIKDLRAAVGRACIIATDTAVKPLLHHGIRPDFAVIVDGKKPAAQMDCEGTEGISLLTCTVVSRNFMNRHHGRKVFYGDDNPYEVAMLEHVNRRRRKDKRELPVLSTGGSVATSAFSFGLHLGSKTVILIGQDLAITGGKPYADHTFDEKVGKVDVSGTEYIEVESIDGGKVMTRPDLKLYLDWFEDQIKAIGKLEGEEAVRVIDATEGGALIHGSEVMTLRDAIKETCQREFSIRELQDDMGEYFSDADKERMLAYFQGTRTRLEKVAKKAREGMGLYDKMLKACRRKELDTQRYLKIADKVRKVNRFMDTDQTALFVSSNLVGVEYTMRATIYMIEEDEKDERIMIARQGILLLESIYHAAQDLISRLPGLIEEYQGDDAVLYARYSEADSKLVI